MKKPYVKKYGLFGDFVAWIVDGRFIRENIDEEFTNFGQHFRFRFIPKKEFWIDEEHGTKEAKYFVEHLLVEYRLMAKGVEQEKALARADAVERRERAKSRLFQRLRKRIEHKQKIIEKIHKKLIREFSTAKMKVWIVDGNVVRDLFDIDFTEGGHDKVYHFVPDGEIWIDDDLDEDERLFVLLHEMHERNLMARGYRYDEYDKRAGRVNKFAHYSASWLEHYCRKHPSQVRKKLKEEMLKSI